MNNFRRGILNNLILELNTIAMNISTESMNEEAELDNIPENLQYSEMYERKESAVELMDAAQESAQETIDLLTKAIEC